MQDYKNINVWRKAHNVVLEIYRITVNFPSYELYGITSQIRRAGVSIPTNIAEGAARGSNADFARFMQISFASASETEYLLFLAFDLKYILEEDFLKLEADITEIKKMLTGFIKKLKATN